MGVRGEYVRWGRRIIPPGIRHPYLFFECLYMLDEKDWKMVEKIAMEANLPVSMVRQYLRIAAIHDLAERKVLSFSSACGDSKVYMYRLNCKVKEVKTGR